MNEQEAQILGTSLPAAAFYIEHLFRDFTDQPISWGWFICPGARLGFTATVGLKG